MEGMNALLFALVLAASFGCGTCEGCWHDSQCKNGWCCNWKCCYSYNYNFYVYLGVGVMFGVITVVGVVVVVVCLLKKKSRPGRVIATTQPASGLTSYSHVTTTNTNGQMQSSSFVYPPPQGSSGDDPYNSPQGTNPPAYSYHPPPEGKSMNW